MRAIPLIRLSPDDTLARRAASGDDDAFAVLYDRYRLRLEAYCRGILRHDEDARDAAQSALANALQALRRGADPVSLRPWLFRIAHNEAITLLRRRRIVDELPETLPGGAGVAETYELHEELKAVLDAVRTLPTGARSALLLRELAGLDYPEVANVLGTTTGGARQAVFEARTALQADRAGRGTDCAEIRHELSVHDGRRRQARHIRGHLRGCGACRDWSRAQRSRRRNLAIGGAPLPLTGWLAGLAAAAAGTGSGAATISSGLALNAQALAAIAAVTIGATPAVVEPERPAAASSRAVVQAPSPARAIPVAQTSPVDGPAKAVVRTTAAKARTRGPVDGRPAGTRRPEVEVEPAAEVDVQREPVRERWAADTAPRRQREGQRPEREAPPAPEAAEVPAEAPATEPPASEPAATEAPVATEAPAVPPAEPPSRRTPSPRPASRSQSA